MNILKNKLRKGKYLSSPLVGYPVCSLNGSTARKNLTNSETQVDTLLKYYNELKPDILFPFMDLAVEAEAIGLKIKIKENDPPEVIEHPIKDQEALNRLPVPDIQNDGRFNVYVETIRGLRANTNAALSGYVTSPFTLAGLLTGAERIAARTITKPKLVKNLIEYATKISLEYALHQAEAGADCLVLLDPTASLLSPELFRKFVTPSINKIANSLNIPVILHVCGDTTPLIDVFIETKMKGFSLDYAVDLKEIMPEIPKDKVVIGNIDPVRTMLGDTPLQVYKKTLNLINELKDFDNFIPGTGCDVPPEAAFENIEAFQRAVNRANHDF